MIFLVRVESYKFHIEGHPEGSVGSILLTNLTIKFFKIFYNLFKFRVCIWQFTFFDFLLFVSNEKVIAILLEE